MERLYNNYKDRGLVILAINDMETKKDVGAFMEEYKLTFPTLLDKAGKVFDMYRVFAIPTSFIIDKKGRLIGKIFGSRQWDNEHVQALIEQLISD